MKQMKKITHNKTIQYPSSFRQPRFKMHNQILLFLVFHFLPGFKDLTKSKVQCQNALPVAHYNVLWASLWPLCRITKQKCLMLNVPHLPIKMM